MRLLYIVVVIYNSLLFGLRLKIATQRVYSNLNGEDEVIMNYRYYND